MKPHSRFEVARKILLGWCLFIGVGAVAGAIGMLVAPDGSALGMDAMLPYFQVLPFADVLFQDFTFSGIALLTVNGLTNLLAAYLIIRRKKLGVILGGVFGVTLMLWICIQFVIFECNFMSSAYFVFGFLQAATGYAAYVFYKQEQFKINIADYPHIGENPRELVVYFSRMGYVKKLALEQANKTGANILEITTPEPTEGTRGFWWCGRFGMHGWSMPINPVTEELDIYDNVTICSPIWVFKLCAPMKSFLALAKGRIKRADYILVHFSKGSQDKVVSYMDEALGLTHDSVKSVRCRIGRYTEQ